MARSFRDLGERVSDGGDIDDDVGAFDSERETDGIAAAGFADGGNVNGGAAVAANDVLAVLAITFGATDTASVERNAPALRLLDNDKAKVLRSGIYRKNMQIPVLNVSQRNMNEVGSRCDHVRGGRSGIGTRIDKIGSERQNHDETRAGGGDHPAALAAALRFEQAPLSFVHSGILLRRRGEPFAEDQENCGAKNKDEEEEFVANDGADQGHFLLAGGNPLRFADFVKAGNSELRGDQPKDEGGNAEEAVQRNFDGALEEEKADCDGCSEAENRADPGL